MGGGHDDHAKHDSHGHGHGGHGDHGHGHDDHGHGHGGGGHGHGHHGPLHYVNHEGYHPEKPPARQPQVGTQEHFDNPRMWNDNPSLADSKPRSVWDRFSRVMRFDVFEEGDRISLSTPTRIQPESWVKWFLGPTMPLKPELYVDAYSRPNPCPEDYWSDTWRWPRTKYVNVKIPPPIDGKYNDYYHMIAFRKWFEMEREVYLAECREVYHMLVRCILKENEKVNGMKNCRHIFNKWFSMSRAEEFHQSMLYMALTGNAAIRETPYPENFVDEKRKIYDDWLFRTRHRRPTDDFVAMDNKSR